MNGKRLSTWTIIHYYHVHWYEARFLKAEMGYNSRYPDKVCEHGKCWLDQLHHNICFKYNPPLNLSLLILRQATEVPIPPTPVPLTGSAASLTMTVDV